MPNYVVLHSSIGGGDKFLSEGDVFEASYFQKEVITHFLAIGAIKSYVPPPPPEEPKEEVKPVAVTPAANAPGQQKKGEPAKK